MISLAQAAARMTANPRPILFLDTCILLDLIRAPQAGSSREVAAGVRLRELTTLGMVAVFVQDIVRQEWQDNLASAQKEGDRGVESFLKTWQIAADLGLPGPPLPVIRPGTMIAQLHQLSIDLLDQAEPLDRDCEAMSWAMSQVTAKKKPSSSRGVVKDAHILGHALQLSRLLVSASYPSSRLFVSSNKSDFIYENNSDRIHPHIQPDATAAQLRYATSLEAALADLQTQNEI